jgi:hypothetical protein
MYNFRCQKVKEGEYPENFSESRLFRGISDPLRNIVTMQVTTVYVQKQPTDLDKNHGTLQWCNEVILKVR